MTRRSDDTGGVRLRGRIYWIHYRVKGVRYFESTAQGDRRVALSLLAERRREIAAGTWAPPTERMRAELTVATYAEGWIKRRRDSGVREVDDEESDLRRWLLAAVGSKAIGNVSRADIKAIVASMSVASGERTKSYAPRTILKAYAAMRVLFADAMAEEVIASTPCTLKARRGELPVKRDKDPRWRAHAVYTRGEAESLISDERIPLDRRVYYGLMLLAGMRASEASGRRWRDWDPEAEPLGRMLIATQADARAERGERETKTLAVKECPVHPMLAALLDVWKREGFAKTYARHPSQDDLIVPSTWDRRSPRTEAACGALKEDLSALGLRTAGRSRHAMRATFLTLLEIDGANMGIARRATHAAPSDVVGGYLRAPWPALCAEIGKLRLTLPRQAEVIPLRRAVGAEPGDNGGDSAADPTQKSHGMRAVSGCRSP